MLRPTVLLCLVTACAGAQVRAQAVSEPPDPVIAPPRSGDVRGAARAAQARYEILRARHFPRARGGSAGPCEETVGRFCTWYSEGSWVPRPEADPVAGLRDELLAALDSLQALAPGDGWILGQRVWYRAEGSDWREALRLADRCEPPQEGWWCEALRGLALHGLGRWIEAERAFDRALYAMDPERAWTWRVPLDVLDGAGRDLLEGLRVAPPDSVARTLDRLWTLADPLHLVEGNDRKTAHFARWTVATLRDGARTPYGIRWGSDLEELLVRHGWELGWEREPDPALAGPDRIIGHKHPEGRDFLPSGGVLRDPARAEAVDLVAGRRRPRSLYAPPYAPLILPMEGQVAVFPRGRAFAVVGTYDLPTDTTWRAREGIERPWMDPGDQSDRPDLAGVHLVDARSGRVVAATERAGSRSGALVLEGEAGAYVLSLELWSPRGRRAGRLRAGLEHVAVPEDVPALSDLLLVRPGGVAPGDLSAAAERALPVPGIERGRPVGLVWELSGLGFRREALTFELSVVRTDRGILQRLGGFLGLTGPAQALALAWDEPAPEVPGPALRYLELDLRDLDPGRYEIRLVLRSAGRDPVSTARVLEVRNPS